MNHPFRKLIPIAIGLGLSILTGCERTPETESAKPSPHALSEYIDRPVRVQFRRDTLGASANLPIGPRTTSTNGAETSLSGKLVRVVDEDIVIEEDRRLKWIPREVILYVELNP